MRTKIVQPRGRPLKNKTEDIKTSSIAKKRGTIRAAGRLGILNADPKYKYGWLFDKEVEKNGFRDLHEFPYEIIRTHNSSGENSVKNGSQDDHYGLDGCVRDGDLILGRMTHEQYEKRVAFEKHKRDIQVDSIKQNVEDDQRRDGVERKLELNVTRGPMY